MNPRFKSHTLNDIQLNKSTKLRIAVADLYEMLNDLPKCRETSAAKARLEECLMWANKAIALHGGNNE